MNGRCHSTGDDFCSAAFGAAGGRRFRALQRQTESSAVNGIHGAEGSTDPALGQSHDTIYIRKGVLLRQEMVLLHDVCRRQSEVALLRRGHRYKQNGYDCSPPPHKCPQLLLEWVSSLPRAAPRRARLRNLRKRRHHARPINSRISNRIMVA
jgi:hypothetical protein